MESSASSNAAISQRLQAEDTEEFADRSLNYYSDQVPDIDPRLRKLNLKWGLQTALEKVTVPSSAILLAGALGFLLKRKFTAASFFAAGFFLQQALSKRRPPVSQSRRSREKQRIDTEVERYALKAQRGDYGKLEVISFK